MMRARPALDPQARYERFLLACVRVDRNGLAVSMLSTLARQDLDPWRVAAELDALSTAAATTRLVTLLGTAHDPSPEALATATRLVALLPHGRAPPGLARPPTAAPAVTNALGPVPALAHLLLAVLVVIALLVGLRHGLMTAAPPAAAPVSPSPPGATRR